MSVARIALAFPVVTDTFIKRKVTLLALVSRIALPFGSALFALPVLWVMMPPEFAVDPLPATVKLPEVFVRMIPLVAPLLETLVKEIASGVVLDARVICTAMPVVVVMSPLEALIVLVLSVASRPLWPASGLMLREPNVAGPLLLVRLTPVPPEALALVLPKFNEAF